ncbi:MAG TPA: antitoxin [Polyangia bacterium]|nr:antitoxin [Polyangia bacterium]
MSKRLQVVFEDEELAEVQRAARRNHMTTSEWVRQVVRKAQRNEARGDPKKKLAVVRRAAEHSFPTADIDQMLAEIERGYLRD